MTRASLSRAAGLAMLIAAMSGGSAEHLCTRCGQPWIDHDTAGNCPDEET